MRPKIISISAPTASGKTDLAIAIAKKFNGEIVNTDSRQIYKYLNIGTAKPEGEWREENGIKAYFVDNVAHHLMDFVEPDQDFSLADFKDLADKKIEEILSRGHLPVLVGGTGLYISAVVENSQIPRVAPDKELREKLEKLSLKELQEMLQNEDPDSAGLIDLKNPRRIIRALEVVKNTGESFFSQRKKSPSKYNALEIGIKTDREKLYKRIDIRVDEQIKDGLVEEVKELSKKYDFSLSSMSSIGYRQIGYFLQGEMGLEEAIEILKRDTRRYAKRQITWFKRNEKIHWIQDLAEAESLVEGFVKK